MGDIEMQYTATFNGRMVQATYELVNSEIVVSGVKVMKEAGWEEQTGDGLKEFGQWMIPMFKILARFKRLRGTPFDIFGLLAERKMERALISEFESTIEILLGGLSASNIDDAASIANLYLEIRGYGPVKEAAAVEVRANIESRLANYLNVTEIAA